MTGPAFDDETVEYVAQVIARAARKHGLTDGTKAEVAEDLHGWRCTTPDKNGGAWAPCTCVEDLAADAARDILLALATAPGWKISTAFTVDFDKGDHMVVETSLTYTHSREPTPEEREEIKEILLPGWDENGAWPPQPF